MSNIIKELEAAMREALGVLPRKAAKQECKDHFFVMLGEELSQEDFDRLWAAARDHKMSVFDYAVMRLRPGREGVVND